MGRDWGLGGAGERRRWVLEDRSLTVAALMPWRMVDSEFVLPVAGEAVAAGAAGLVTRDAIVHGHDQWGGVGGVR